MLLVSVSTTTNSELKQLKNVLILEQLLLGDFQIADLLLFTWALINTQPRQDLIIGLST